MVKLVFCCPIKSSYGFCCKDVSTHFYVGVRCIVMCYMELLHDIIDKDTKKICPLRPLSFVIVTHLILVLVQMHELAWSGEIITLALPLGKQVIVEEFWHTSHFCFQKFYPIIQLKPWKRGMCLPWRQHYILICGSQGLLDAFSVIWISWMM